MKARPIIPETVADLFEELHHDAPHGGSNVLPFPIAAHRSWVDKEARRILAGKTSLFRVLDRRTAYHLRTMVPAGLACRDLASLEAVLIARMEELARADHA